MKRTPITIGLDKEIHHFQITEHPHSEGKSCKYQVYEQGNFVASFRPDRQHFLHVCQNPAGLSEELLHLLADHIEARQPRERDLGGLQSIEFDGDDELEAPPQYE